MDSHPEIGMLILLWATSLAAAAWAYARQHDPFDPGVFIPIVYAYLTTGPCLFTILMGEEYHPGLKIQMLQPVLLSCTTAVIGYAIGCSLALKTSRQYTGAQSIRGSGSNLAKTGNRWSISLLRGISMVGCVLSLSVFAWAAFQLQLNSNGGGVDKAEVLAAADHTTVMQLNLSAASTSLLMTFFVITDSHVSKTAFSWPVILLLGADFLICAAVGERDFMLVAIIWFTVNWKRLPASLAVATFVFFVFWMGASAAVRTSGLGLLNQWESLADIRFEEWFKCVTCISGSLLVYTNVAYEVPATENHWYGRSLFDVALSFLPGNSQYANDTPAQWFMRVYDWQRVAGHAFSQDAEAYLNFGWIGPPIWFSVWGWLMGVAYRRATRPSAHLSDVFIWWHATAVSLFAIRSDSRTPAKMLVFGIVVSKLICYLADLWGSQQSRVDVAAVAIQAKKDTAIRSPTPSRERARITTSPQRRAAG